MLPGRYPSSTPSLPSNSPTNCLNPTSTFNISIDRISDPVVPARVSSANHTAPSSSRERPLFAETQSEASLHIPKPPKSTNLCVKGSPPIAGNTERPSKKRVVSDPRHDRIRTQSNGSPMRKRQQRSPRASQVPRNAPLQAAAHKCRPAPQETDTSSQPEEAQFRLSTTAEELAPKLRLISVEPKSPREVHGELRRRIYKDIRPDPTKGSVYIFRNRDHPHLLKIGASQEPTERLKQLETKCGIGLEYVDSIDGLSNYFRVEFLAQADLSNFCRPYWCIDCNVTHTEWHHVSEELAKATIRRWGMFMKKQRPYNSKGKLKEIWCHLFFERTENLLKDPDLDHDKRWNSCSSILEPPKLRHYCALYFPKLINHPVWWDLWENSWQVSTVVSWMVAFHFSQNPYVFVILCLSVACTWVSMSARPLKSPRKISKAKGEKKAPLEN